MSPGFRTFNRFSVPGQQFKVRAQGLGMQSWIENAGPETPRSLNQEIYHKL